MFTSLIGTLEKEIKLIKYSIKLFESQYAVDDEFEMTEKRKFSTYSTVVRVYALLEYSLEKALIYYLDTIADILKYEDFDNKFKNEYRILLSKLISKLNQERYSHLQETEIINNYNNYINNNDDYKLSHTALLNHEQNLRLDTIDKLFRQVGITDFNKWIIKNHNITKLFEINEPVSDIIDTELKNLVADRNDVAHGELQNLPGKSTLERYMEVVESIIKGSCELLTFYIYKAYKEKDKTIYIGKVTEKFRNGACIMKSKNNVCIEKGEKLIAKNNNFCKQVTIESIQVDDNDFLVYKSTTDDFEFGIKFSKELKKRSHIYRIVDST